MLSLPSIEGVDNLPIGGGEKKADYLGMERKFVFEQKAITAEQASRIDREIEKYARDKNFPLFYGTRDINLVIDKLPNKDQIHRDIYSSITKILESYLSQANKQISSTKIILDISGSLGVLVILNENIRVLSPEVIATRIQQRLREERDGKLRFSAIDYVLLFSETHTFQGRPIAVSIEGHGATNTSPEQAEYIRYIIHSWSQFNGGDCLEIKSGASFFDKLTEVKDVPPARTSRSEARVAWYREDRYMKSWSDEQVLKGAAKYVELIQPFVMKDGPKLPTTEMAEMMMEFGDFIEESNLRGLDLRDMRAFHSAIT
jgi:hypothetical protein